MRSASRPRAPRMWAVGLVAAVLFGAALRLVWVGDIEYKGDEAWTFDRSQRMGRTEPFRWFGMPSSVEILNPGMSVWVFVGLSAAVGAHDPPDLARAVQLLSIAAIALLIWFAFRSIAATEREPWLWAAALMAVNPLAVLFHRKIWPPSVLPLFTVLLLVCWWNRDRRRGACAWGLVGACLGQVHISGFFFAAGLVTWALLFDRKRVAWVSWMVGSCVGALPMIPWLAYVLTEPRSRWTPAMKWTHWFELKFWLYWITEPVGLGIEHSLGRDFRDFLGYPLISGRPTYLVLLLHLMFIVVGCRLLFAAGRRLWRERHRWHEVLIGRQSPSAFTQNAVLWGSGVLLTASGLAIHRHYMIVTLPLECLWLARLALAQRSADAAALRVGRALLLVLCIAQALISATFLGYIHVNHGAIHGDYGVAYSGQHVHAPVDR